MPDEKKKRSRTDAQKAARKKQRSGASKKAQEHGAKILAAALGAGGYKPGAKPARFVGKGGYNMLKAKMRGRGDYVDDIVGGGAKLLGDGIRSVGSKALGWLTNGAKSLVGSLFGSGDYASVLHSGSPNANNMSNVTTSMPEVVSTKGRGNVIRNTEMIAPVFAHEALTTVEFHISPGLVSTFPWLHPNGDMYQEWRMNGGVVTYVPTVAPLDDAAGGDLVLHCEYDLDAPMPTTIQECVGAYMAVAGRPLDRMVMGIECAPHETPYNVYLTRTTELLDTPHYPYDLGKLRITTGNQPSSVEGKMIGRLYFTYEVEFFKPQVRSIPLTIPMARISNAVSPFSGSAPFYSTNTSFEASIDPTSTLRPTWISATKIQLPYSVRSGKWMMIWQCAGSPAGTATVQGVVTYTDAVAAFLFVDTAGAPATGCDSVTAGLAQVSNIVIAAFEAVGPAPTITMTGWTLDSGVGTILILPYNSDVTRMSREMRNNRDTLERKSAEAANMTRMITRLVDERVEQDRHDGEEKVAITRPRGPRLFPEDLNEDKSIRRDGQSYMRQVERQVGARTLDETREEWLRQQQVLLDERDYDNVSVTSGVSARSKATTVPPK